MAQNDPLLQTSRQCNTIYSTTLAIENVDGSSCVSFAVVCIVLGWCGSGLSCCLWTSLELLMRTLSRSSVPHTLDHTVQDQVTCRHYYFNKSSFTKLPQNSLNNLSSLSAVDSLISNLKPNLSFSMNIICKMEINMFSALLYQHNPLTKCIYLNCYCSYYLIKKDNFTDIQKKLLAHEQL